MPTKHIPHLDYVRVLACPLVCTVHAPLPANGAGSPWLSLFNYAASPCNALFFMLSGSLLFPIKKELREYLPHKIRRIAYPVLFWTIVTLVIWLIQGKLSVSEAFHSIIVMPFDKVNGIYWFLYVLLGLYFVAPLLSPAFEKKRNMEYFLFLWAITLTLPYVSPWLGNFWNADGSFYKLLSPFGGFMGYMVLGAYLQQYPAEVSKRVAILIIPSLLLIVGIPASFIIFHIPPIDNGTIYNNLVLNVALMATDYFLLIRFIAPHLSILNSLIKELSSKTFGIYLVHIFIMQDLLWPVWESILPHASYAIQIPITSILTFIISYIIIKLISYIPGSHYII